MCAVPMVLMVLMVRRAMVRTMVGLGACAIEINRFKPDTSTRLKSLPRS
jgi:hypothetical protein